MNVLLAASAGALAGMGYGQFRYGKPDVFFTYSGLLGGLVAITAGAASVGNVGAVITGAIGGLIVPLMTFEVDMRWHLDDPLGVVALHGFGGLWSLVAAALFTSTVSGFGAHLKLLGVQLMGAAIIAVVAAVISIVTFVVVKAVIGLRVVDADEFDGLDLGEHDINAYPDFQQTTIKSYHLREA
jgi:Amt family ammonium transporter